MRLYYSSAWNPNYFTTADWQIQQFLAVKMVQIVQVGIFYILLVKFESQFFFVTDQQDSRGLFSMVLIQRPETRLVHLRETCRWLLDWRGWCGWLPDNGLWQSEHHVQRAPSCGHRAPSWKQQLISVWYMIVLRKSYPGCADSSVIWVVVLYCSTTCFSFRS